MVVDVSSLALKRPSARGFVLCEGREISIMKEVSKKMAPLSSLQLQLVSKRRVLCCGYDGCWTFFLLEKSEYFFQILFGHCCFLSVLNLFV